MNDDIYRPRRLRSRNAGSSWTPVNAFSCTRRTTFVGPELSDVLGKSHESCIYLDRLDGRIFPGHRLKIYDRTLDWLRFWLEGEEDPNPGKGQQNVRRREPLKPEQESEARTTPN